MAGAAMLPGQSRVDGQPAMAGRHVLNTAETGAETWRFTTEKPAEGWIEAGFNDQGWKQGKGGFGTAGTPNAIIGTEWSTSNIWLRREFEVPLGKLEPQVLRLHHDEDAEVFLNGKLAAMTSNR